MTWDVLQDANGNLQLIVTGEPTPDGWNVVAITCDADYLEYMASLG